MADNIKITPATEGTLFDYALDDIGGVLHQRVKVQFGEDGSATDVSATDPMPVTMPGASTEATLSALVASLDALSAKVSACNTGAVTLDAATLAALETINAVVSGAVTVSNFTDNGLTDAQLRASAVPVSGTFYQATQPVSAAALPLPAGAATETTLAEANAKLPALESGRIPVVLPAGGGGLTDAELRATPIPVSGSFAAAPPDDTAALMTALRALVHPIWEEAASGRLRVVLDPIGGAQTLGTVTTVGTVNNMTSVNQIAAIPANSFIYDQMHAAWANSVRRCIA